MEATVDKFGRIVIPKRIRDHLGIGPGSRLKIEQKQDCVVLSARADEPMLRYEDGVLIYDGEAEGDLGNAIIRDRDERLRKNSGNS